MKRRNTGLAGLFGRFLCAIGDHDWAPIIEGMAGERCGRGWDEYVPLDNRGTYDRVPAGCQARRYLRSAPGAGVYEALVREQQSRER